MIRSSTLAVAAIAMMITAGCDNAADEQNKANAAQAEANAKINQAKADADKKVKEAQADADKKIAEAQAGFMKLREDYRHTMTTNLADLDKKVVELEAKAKTATGKAKADLDASLTTIRERRDRFGTNFNGLEKATSATWDATKASLEKEWTELKALVDKT